MITQTDNNICGPLNTNKNINKILLQDINYSSKTLLDGFISRDVNFYEDKNPTFTKIINDCQNRPIYEINKYKEIILNKQDAGEDSEETLDKLIENMENKIRSIDNKILNTYKKTILLDQSLPENYKSNKPLNKEDEDILIRLNGILEEFSKNNYTKDNL